MAHQKTLLLHLFVFFLHITSGAGSSEEQASDEETAWLTFSTQDVELVAKKHENATVFLLLRGTTQECISVNFTYDPGNPSIEPLSDLLMCPSLSSNTPISLASENCKGCGRKARQHLSLPPDYQRPSPLFRALQVWPIKIRSIQPVSSDGVLANETIELVSRWVGKTVLQITTNSSSVKVDDAFMRISVVHTRSLDVASEILGWMYTITWDVSFLPQVWLNWRRKSVVGLSMDNVTLNFIAYLYYSLFNVFLFWSPFIQDQFRERYPTSVSHVHPNDVFFATYALTLEIVLVIQCIMYGRNKGLKVSWPCRGLVGASVLAVTVACILAAVGVVWWLDVFYLMSYMKLVITPLKYIPQVYVIYLVKNTRGFSVMGAVMDFSGGLMSLAQMLLLAGNSNDYLSIFNNFSKFGLGIVTLFFDIIYFCQHWYYHFRPGK